MFGHDFHAVAHVCDFLPLAQAVDAEYGDELKLSAIVGAAVNGSRMYGLFRPEPPNAWACAGVMAVGSALVNTFVSKNLNLVMGCQMLLCPFRTDDNGMKVARFYVAPFLEHVVESISVRWR